MSDTLGDLEQHLRLLQLLAMLGGSSTASTSSNSSNSSRGSEDERPRNRLPDYIMVAAIDFGTTFSGYAFSFKTSKDEIKMNKNWGAEVGFSSYKAPTCLLLDPNRRFDSFGYEAQQKYAGMVEQEDRNYYFFERFKMKLHNAKDLNKETKLEAANGKSLPALDVFALSLKYLKDHLTNAVNQATTSKVSSKMVRWVITVPAIWSDASKQFMRQAALQGGLIEELDSGQLVIALEPEAASLHVRKLDINQFVTHDVSDKPNLSLRPGTKYLVIDAGGGTLDVTAHELLRDGKVKELHFATGGPLGGTKVDEQFVNLLNDIFGKDFIDSFQRENASGWLQIMCDFERKKRACKASENASTNIQMPWSIGEAYSKKQKKSVEAAFKSYRGSGVRFANGMICLKPEVMKKLFEPVTKGIIRHIQGLLELPKLQDVDYFFCVGGFSESGLFQDAIFSNFSNAVQILVPGECSLAVVKGAIQFGHAPDSISSRVSAKTYGVETMSQFIPMIHPHSKAVPIEGNMYCKDIFRTFVKCGEEVPVGYTKTIEFSPVRSNQDEADVEIFTSDNEEVGFITDDDVEHHGKISVVWPGSGTDRKLKIKMHFGGTEVEVEATSYPGGNSTDTRLNFFAQ